MTPLATEYIPNLSYDSVIFGFSGEKLKILVLEYHNLKTHALPGGFIKKDENLDDAVKRGLMERTGLEEIYLEQFHTFGSMDRYSPQVMRRIMEEQGEEVTSDHWLLGRFITVGYYALINYENVTPTPDELSDSIDWYDYDSLPELMMDHNDIVSKALEHLRTHLDQKLLSMNLLPEKFTMKDLQQLYEAILGEKLNRANFQRKMLALDILERHDKLYSGGSHKAPYLYSFKMIS
ncbi:NUDIX domain-containing protein [Algoriphagus halophytocola]|uniref:NUDIX domain-containing protein n=1 Tax=Algoriphagus halophytocola TaxID=2991499 RepID=A0ABY6MK28_9BACT|nr:MULTISPECIES: NUDIX domain-containing protein [unclassified Algoriphagus]UZD24140.1 NUDIX domain-containing protein [Algoriphagus sp. TR-M5]WBL41511.1 NUDIX domain-containing protein [Algoriphagus sp. TR-M9]